MLYAVQIDPPIGHTLVSDWGGFCVRFFTRLEVLVVVSLAEVHILQALDRATDVGGSIRSDPVPSWVLSQKSCSVPAPLRLGRNTPYARSLVVTDNWNPHWLGNETHCGRRGVWDCGGCATRHHRSVCCRLDAGSGDPHHNILVRLHLVYHLGGGRIAAACAFLCETPKLHGGSKAPCSTLACSRRGAANSIFSGSALSHGRKACRMKTWR